MSNHTFLFATKQGAYHETHLSTVGCSSQTHARLSRPHVYPGWTGGHSCPSRQRPPSPGCLIHGSGVARATNTGASFPRRYRLTKTDEFSSVFGFRKALRSSHFLLHWRTRTAAEAQDPRLGLVVAKKLLPRAVDRNLIRRLAREHFRLLRQGLPARDLILRLAARPVELNRLQLAAEIRGLLGRLTEAVR